MKIPTALAFLMLALPAAAQTAVDGDTIKLNGTTYRLWGIDAAEAKQWCGDYAAGVIAAGALVTLMKGRSVECEAKTTDRYGRTVAICRADGEDLSKAMVRLGMAWAFTRYSHDYLAEEASAKAENLGVHARTCKFPWEWRAQEKTSQ